MTPAYVQAKVFVGCIRGGNHAESQRLADELITARRRLLQEGDLGWDLCYRPGSAVPPMGSVLLGAVTSTVSGECDLNIYAYPVRPDAMVLRDRCEEEPVPMSERKSTNPHVNLDKRYRIECRVASDEPWTECEQDGRYDTAKEAEEVAVACSRKAIQYGMVQVVDSYTGRRAACFSGGHPCP